MGCCRQVIRSLSGSSMRKNDQWMRELAIMEANDTKAEIEAAYRHSGYGAFARDLAARLLQRRWL